LLAFLHEVTRMANEDHRVVEAEVVVETERDGRALIRQFYVDSVSFDSESGKVYVKIKPGVAE
jgi:hypothetical protein